MPTDDEPKTDQLREVVIEVARTQLAAVTASTKFWAGWIQATDRYAQAISGELARIDQQEPGSQAFVGRFSDLTREYVRDLTELPSVAVKHFNGELEKIGTPRKGRRRAARVKE